MMLVRALLPPLRSLTRVNSLAGGPLLGAALLRCLTPAWTLLPPRTATRLARSE